MLKTKKYNRRNKYTLALAASVLLLAAGCNRGLNGFRGEEYESDGMENPLARQQWENRRLADPATGRIPEHIRARELAFAATLPQARQAARSKNGLSLWKSRGPWNVGGRTRALAIDVTNENIILAGSISNGIWRSENGGQTWNRASRMDQQPNITCLTQKKRPGKTNIWYCGTGEYIGNSASGDGAFYVGNGLMKSLDGGRNWSSLTATATNSPQSFQEWDLIYNVAVSDADTADVVYAATYGSIYRSEDGGKSWAKARGADGSPQSRASVYTDVAVTPSGVVYATMSSDGSQKGIWRSTDGKTWVNITPQGFPATYQRIVIGISPSDENQVWFLGLTPDGGKSFTDWRGREEWSSLWKFTHKSNSQGVWSNRSENLPAWGGDFGNFQMQGGYDIVMRVKPNDTNTVFVGGTNLWRSTDGFTTTTKQSWIGGYGVNTKRPGYTMYENHHPDQHNLVFFPSNPDKMISSHDGGLSLCEENTATDIKWKSLNNGFASTQFYSIALDHATPGNEEIIGGLQDNGTHFTRSANERDPWSMPYSSDGGYAYIADGRTDYYVSTQEGKVYRLKMNAQGKWDQMARLDPKDANYAQFINPYVIDPNNQKRMYYLNGDRIWKNDDVTQIPMHSTIDTAAVNTGWSVMPATISQGLEINALSVSREPADILVFGTTTGKVYKLENASSSNPQKKDITGTNFPGNGFVSHIAIDPLNASRMLVVFSNYGIRSLYATTNGGQSWTDVSANLEQFSTGVGNGPSCRWGAFLPVAGGKYAIFVATSTGLYSTDTLKGAQTQWVQQAPDVIGNAIVTMLDTRASDGRIVAATHGAGVFAANIHYSYQITGMDEEILSAETAGFEVYPNPSSDQVYLRWDVSRLGNTARAELLDERGRILQTRQVTAGEGISLTQYSPGMYYCRLILKDGTSVSRSVVVGR